MSLSDFGFLVQNFAELLDWRYVVMWAIGGILIFLAIKYEMEPTLLLPLGFGTILVNIPFSGAVDRLFDGKLQEGALSTLYKAGIENELFPLILFIGIGAMIDFGPLLSNPKLMIFGAAAQFGIFFTLSLASLLGFELKDAASIAIIGAVRNILHLLCGIDVLRFKRRGFDRHYRRGGRSYRDCSISKAQFGLSGSYNGGGVFVYGACAHNSAARNKAANHQKGAAYKNAVPR